MELEIEMLDIKNVFEIQRIRQMLLHEPDLLAIFELLCIVINKRLNNDKPAEILKLFNGDITSDEDDIDLSDHSSDDD